MKVSYNNTKHEYFGKIQKYNTSNSIDVLETIQTITTNNQKRQDVYNNQNLFYVQLSAGNSYVSSLHCSLMSDGRVYTMPYLTTTARIYDPINNKVIIPSGTFLSGSYIGSVCLNNGKIICIPTSPSATVKIKIYDPVTDTKTTFSLGIYGHCSGVVLPDGRIFCNPSSLSYATIVVPHFTQFQSNNNQFPLQLLLSATCPTRLRL
jgi:hypothetical protein